MDEQSKPPRRPRMAGDAERALIGRTHRVDNVPAFVDPASEVSASVLMAAQLDVLGDRIEQIGKSLSTWVNETVRHNEQIKALSTSVGAVVTYTDAARISQERTVAKLSRNEELLSEISTTLKDLVVRIGRLEGSVDRLSEKHEDLEERLTANEGKVGDLDTRVKALEQTGRDSLVRVDERKRILTWGKAALFGAGGAVAAIAEQLGLFG